MLGLQLFADAIVERSELTPAAPDGQLLLRHRGQGQQRAEGGRRAEQRATVENRRPSPAMTAGREQWRSPEPKAAYDAIIVGAGGHGLATAYYMAKEHGLTNIAVLEKGWLGGGNTGRNTTIVRSNYLWEESEAIYEHAMKLWEGLSHELNYNVMYSPRGVMMLAHNTHDVQVFKRHVHANRLAGIDNDWLTPGGRRKPSARCSTSPRTSAIRSSARPCSGAAAPRGMMRWPGAMPALPTARRRHHPELRGHRHPPRRHRRGLPASRRQRASSAHPKVGVVAAGTPRF
jgi:sarcosine oxidase subunit beta